MNWRGNDMEDRAAKKERKRKKLQLLHPWDTHYQLSISKIGCLLLVFLGGVFWRLFIRDKDKIRHFQVLVGVKSSNKITTRLQTALSKRSVGAYREQGWKSVWMDDALTAEISEMYNENSEISNKVLFFLDYVR